MLYASWTFFCGCDTNATIFQLVVGAGFGALSRHWLIEFILELNLSRYFVELCPEFIKLMVDKNAAPFFVVVENLINEWVWPITPVKSPANPVKGFDFIISDLAKYNVVEYLATGTGDLSQICLLYTSRCV